MKSTSIQLEFEASELRSLQEAAQRMNIKVDVLLKKIVAQFLARFPTDNSDKSKDYMCIVALGSSGAKNISAEHDRHLGEALAHEHLR